MSDSVLAITIIWVFLFIYSIAGSIDFGAGFWAMASMRRRDNHAASIANLYLSPSWKVTNVFLVLLVVALVGFFPHAVYVLGSVLLLPAGLMLVLLIIRSTFMVYAYSVRRYVRLLTVVSGVTGLLIPGLLISVLPVSLGGFVTMESGYPQLLFGKLLGSVTEYAHLAFGISTELFLSALFLADYAREADDEDTYRYYRVRAILLGPLTLITAILVTVTFAPEAQWILPNLQRVEGWFALSVTAFLIGYSALFWRSGRENPGKPRAAVIAIVLQYGLAVFAYGKAHLPYIVYPSQTIDQSVTNHSMFVSLLTGYIVFSAILAPVFVWFWRLFFKDKGYLRQE
ncbi:cytochrome d ubiquinol oxidase subunit II [Paenibacillus aurantius]|uniref:Cytochrome d ubiquinol oxidase subunit II n=1 Tax=Paenibacillus aurantius TaxID=2918900 RepID=A0AA96LCL8_9BACL|nr:cytochrome d ubiquinol oxidase subunit II [Paenibacillus aurantius]WNQ11196.1 cytochrome d ubiquinol oxidase subunit II [Paenibacillus aurantius]